MSPVTYPQSNAPSWSLGSVLQWMTSFLTGRTQQVLYDGSLSSTPPVFYGVLQGSVLGPLLFTMYTADISKVVASHGLQLHQYADDCQVYLFFSPDVVPSAVTQLSSYLADVAAWLSASRLRLNPLASPAMGHWGMCPPGACACTPIGQFLFRYNSSGQW